MNLSAVAATRSSSVYLATVAPRSRRSSSCSCSNSAVSTLSRTTLRTSLFKLGSPTCRRSWAALGTAQVSSYVEYIYIVSKSYVFLLVNFFFALPAIKTIDTFGRRNLLLTTFPLMALFLLMTGFAFWIPESSKAHVGIITLGIYLFTMVYSPGEGPVPFTYSAEAFPLYIREIGMSFATATTWFFNFVISITTPRLIGAFSPQGAFGWYAGWKYVSLLFLNVSVKMLTLTCLHFYSIVGFVLILLFVPETKALSLEELDQVFSVPTHVHATYQLKALPHNIKKYIFRRRVEPLPPLYHHEGEKTFAPQAVGH